MKQKKMILPDGNLDKRMKCIGNDKYVSKYKHFLFLILKITLEQWFSMGEILPPGDILACNDWEWW